MKAYNLIQFGT